MKVRVSTIPKDPLAFEELKGPLRDFEEKSLYVLLGVKIAWGPNLTEVYVRLLTLTHAKIFGWVIIRNWWLFRPGQLLRKGRPDS